MKVFSKVYCDRVYFLCSVWDRVRFWPPPPQRHPLPSWEVSAPPPPPGNSNISPIPCNVSFEECDTAILESYGHHVQVARWLQWPSHWKLHCFRARLVWCVCMMGCWICLSGNNNNNKVNSYSAITIIILRYCPSWKELHAWTNARSGRETRSWGGLPLEADVQPASWGLFSLCIASTEKRTKIVLNDNDVYEPSYTHSPCTNL